MLGTESELHSMDCKIWHLTENAQAHKRIMIFATKQCVLAPFAAIKDTLTANIKAMVRAEQLTTWSCAKLRLET